MHASRFEGSAVSLVLDWSVVVFSVSHAADACFSYARLPELRTAARLLKAAKRQRQTP